MAKRIIEIEVNDEYVLGSGVVIGAAGSDESVILRVAFNDTWAGLNIYVTFRDSMGESPTIMMLMPSMLVPGETMKYDVVVPAAATKYAGKMCLVFSGFAITESYLYAKDGDTVVKELVYRDAVINTTNAYFRVLPSDFSALDVEDQAEATVLEQVLAEINAFRDELDEHEDEIADTIGDLGTYEKNGKKIPYTVEGRLAAQDTKLEAQDGKVDKVYEAYENGELKGDSYILTEEDKSDIADIAKEGAIGDIDTALDAISAIQAELIGSLLSCNAISHEHGAIEGCSFKLYFEEGMTWEDWLVSKYNFNGAYIYLDTYIALPHDSGNLVIYTDTTNYDMVSLNDNIIENHTYGLYLW